MSLIEQVRTLFSRKQSLLQILRSFVMLGGSSALAQVIAFANTILIARTLSPVGAGQISGTYAVVGLTALLMNWGLDGWFLREGSLHADPRKLLGEVMSLKALLGLIWGVGLFFLLPLVKPDTFDLTLLGLCILDIWFNSLLNAQLTALNASGRIPTQSGLLFGLQAGRLAGTLLLIFLGSRSVPLYILTRLLSTAAVFAVTAWVVRPQFPGGMARVPWRYVRLSSVFAVNDLLAVVYLQADVSLLTLIAGPGAKVGLYSSASNLVNALFVIPTAGYYVLLPVMTRLYQARNPRFFRNTREIFIGFALMGAVLWLGLYASGRFLAVTLLGEAFRPSGEILTILSPILFLKSINFAAAVLLVTIDWQRYRAVVQFFSAAANVGLNLLVIVPFGIQGVAYVYVISELILMIGYIWLSLRGMRGLKTAWQQGSSPEPAGSISS